MKNIYLLPTDKPSRLAIEDKELILVDNIGNYRNAQHIYITSDEEIILTTDQDLIKDGVQAIDDEFLEWFVKNPSCEEVEVESGLFFYAEGEDRRYKIIIPKEEPNPHILSCCRTKEECHCGKYSKQETLEEAAETNSEKHHYAFGQQSEFYQLGFIEGVKWQQERMYSEEDLIELLNFVTKEYNISNGIGWFHTHDSIEDVSSKEVLEQFKKK